jgi:hypothetical protein
MAAVSEWIEIMDFSPGIYSARNANNQSSTRKDGAATIENTYRCKADMSGRLVPLPGRGAGISTSVHNHIPVDAGILDSAFSPSLPDTYTLDGLVMSPRYSTLQVSQPTNPDQVHMMWGAVLNFDGGFRYYIGGRQYNEYNSAQPSKDFVLSRSGGVLANTTALSIPSAMLDRGRTSKLDAPTALDYKVTMIGAIGSDDFNVMDGTAISASPLSDQASNYNNTMSFNGAGTALNFFNNNAFILPDIEVISPTDRDLRSIATVRNFNFALAHQGRAVLSQSSKGPGINDNYKADIITYSNSGRYATGANYAIYGEESPFPIGTMASLNAQELLVVKHDGGGVIVRGDIANPTVSRLPYLQSTMGITHRGVTTSDGFFYGSKQGIYQWTGGQSAKLVSPQLEGWFWQHTTLPYSGNSARFGNLEGMVCVPNNYLYNPMTESWWRLEDPTTNASTPYAFYDRSVTGRLYAFPWKMATGGNIRAYDVFDPATLATSYSWQSQPLLRSTQSLTTVQEIEIIAQSGSAVANTITVTLTGFDDNGTLLTSSVETFSLTNTGSPIHKVNLVSPNFTARHIRVRVQANGGTGAAPTIYGMRIGVRDGQRVGRQ